MKKVEILYFQGCPNHEPARKLVQDVARECGVGIELRETEVLSTEAAVKHRFLGSPSVRVEGVDVEPSARSSETFALACRTYGASGVPNREWVRSALLANSSNEGASPNARYGAWLGGALLTSLLASVCCLGPVVLGAIGLGTVSGALLFAPLRPFFLFTTASLIAGAFYAVYFKRPACTPGSACSTDPSAGRRSRTFLWMLTAVIGLLALFPVYGGALLRIGQSSVSTKDGTPPVTVTLRINGMTCEACTVAIEKRLAAISGVESAAVDYQNGTASVKLDTGTSPTPKTLTDAIRSLGYEAQFEADNSRE